MNKRWKPDNIYYCIDVVGKVYMYTWDDDDVDVLHYEFGNCFETEEQAEAASAKVKELLLSMSSAPEKSSAQLPKLTEEVFDRQDCPKWAKYAAVDNDGEGWYYEHKPVVGCSPNFVSIGTRTRKIDGTFDATDWQNSLIERPAKLPEWCKVDAMGWHKRCGYFKVTYIDDVFKRVDIQWIDDKSSGYFSFHTVYNETVQAKPRPYNAEEMQKLVGKVLDLDGNRDLVTSYDENSESVYADAMWINSDELLSIGYTIDGEPCGKLVHKDGDDWVE